jgi:thiosulfate dehydrogenase
MIRFLFGILIGVLLLPAGVWVLLHYGRLPVAVADRSLPLEEKITHLALNARVEREQPMTTPVQADEKTFIAGAHIYRERCSFCHGLSGGGSATGSHMFPGAPLLWEKHSGSAVVGVSDDPAAETYWKVANGIRLSGMPAYRQVLSDTEMWQVSVLLANADKPLPPVAVVLLREPLVLDPAPPPPFLATPVGPGKP